MSISINPNNANAYDFRGRAYYFLKDYKSAITDTNKAICLGVNNFSVFDCRGRSYFYLKQYDKAIDDFKTALKIKPDNAELHEFLKKVYAEMQAQRLVK